MKDDLVRSATMGCGMTLLTPFVADRTKSRIYNLKSLDLLLSAPFHRT